MNIKQNASAARKESILPATKNNYEDDKIYVEKRFWAKVKKIIGKVPFLADAISLYYCAIDAKTPFKSKAIAFSSLAYFILPIDIIPDLILAVGYSDDAGAIAAAIMALKPFVTEEHRRKAKDFLADRMV